MKIPKSILVKKLTEFITDCKNEAALTYFLKQVMGSENAKWKSTDQIVVVLRGQSLELNPLELVSFILEEATNQRVIRDSVTYVKANFDYKNA